MIQTIIIDNILSDNDIGIIEIIKIVPIGTVGQLCALSVGPFVSCYTWSRYVGDHDIIV